MSSLNLAKSTLRTFQLSDATTIAQQANNINIYNQLRDHFPHPYTLKDAQEWVAFAGSKECIDLQFAIEVEGLAVGGIGLLKKEGNLRHSAELGFWLGEPYWGKGIITEAVNGIVAYGFKTWQLARIYACCFENNKASQRVLEKCGFKLEGVLRNGVIKNEKIIDEWRYSILAEEFLRQ